MVSFEIRHLTPFLFDVSLGSVNFLGHIYLSPNDDQILLGNFIADSVKGNPDKYYSGKIAEGIRFHRAIDHFTDNHPIVKQGIERLRESQGRWAPVVIDVLYDHVLASNWSVYHQTELENFTQTVYDRLGAQASHFPNRVGQFFPYMISQNWLYNYQFEWGLIKSLEGLDRRTSIETQMHLAVEVYRDHEAEFSAEFQMFIKEAQEMADNYFST